MPVPLLGKREEAGQEGISEGFPAPTVRDSLSVGWGQFSQALTSVLLLSQATPKGHRSSTEPRAVSQECLP